MEVSPVDQQSGSLLVEVAQTSTLGRMTMASTRSANMNWEKVVGPEEVLATLICSV